MKRYIITVKNSILISVNRLTTIVIIMFFCLSQTKAIDFTVSSFALSNQLPSNSVQRIYQDKEGYMWLGTLDGISRYDGYRLITFRSDVRNPHLLPNNEITSLCEDTQSYLWIGTKKGISILDKRNYSFKQLKLPDVNNVEIRSITVSSDGYIWVGTYRHLICFNPDHTIRKAYKKSIPIASVNSIYEDSDKNIWVTLWGKGLFLYDKLSDEFIQLPGIGTNNNPFKVFQDKNKNIWIASWGDGIFRLEKRNGVYIYANPYANENSITEKNFFSIEQDDLNGYLWFISLSRLFVFDLEDGNKLREIDITQQMTSTNNIFSEIKKDLQGNLWLATFGESVLTIDLNRSIVQNIPFPGMKVRTGIKPNITTIYEDSDGLLWINQNRYGLAIMNTRTHELYLHDDIAALKNLRGLSEVDAISGFRSLPDEIWISSTFPLIYSVKKLGKNFNFILHHVYNLEEIKADCGRVIQFFEDRMNNIWIITQNHIFIRYFNSEKIELIDLPISSITGITEDTKGHIWISSSVGGLYELFFSGDRVNTSQINHHNNQNSNIASNNIVVTSGDLNGKVWIGTDEGYIYYYDILKKEFSDITSSFSRINEGILNIVSGNFGKIWVSTNRRIVEYNPENGAINEYKANEDLVISSFMKNSYFKNKSGKLLYGGNNGISIFSPTENSVSIPEKVRVFVTDVKVNNKSVFENNDNKSFKILDQIIRLDPTAKNIEIDFSSLDFNTPHKVQYAYRMEGIDDDWIYTKENRQFAVYNNLKKGKHTFLIKATDKNNLWSTEVNQFFIHKRPAFYESILAYIIYLISIVLLILFTFRTIKSRIRLKNELKFAQIEKDTSEELIQTKLSYFTNISHDFMTPLTIVSCLIDDVEMNSNEKVSQFDVMRSNIYRLQRLLQQVLDFRKVESRNMKLKLSTGDIISFIKDIGVSHFDPLIQSKQINFKFESNREHLQAYFDSDKIDKVLFNLLSNAYKFTPENGEIKLILETNANNKSLKIKVSDTGIGIAKEEQAHIFTRFYSDSGGRRHDSNGIGLSLTKDLVELHHGTIRVESDSNQGTTFTVEIPIDRDSFNVIEIDSAVMLSHNTNTKSNVSEEIDHTPLAEKSSQNKPTNEDITLLLVEDNRDLLDVIKSILSNYYTVLTATNGIKALEVIKENNVDIIVSDVMMPEMDGFELTKTLKSDLETSHIPVILLTAKNSPEDRIACYDAGANAYISKPFQLKVLEARISNFLANKKVKQEEFKSDVEINISTLEFTSFDETFLDNAIKIIETNMEDSELNVNSFAELVGMSKSSLYRKVKSMTGLSPNELIRNIRLKHACQLLKNPFVSISEVAYTVGFSDPKYFTLCFKNEFNMTPREYQRTHGSDMTDSDGKLQ